MAGNGSTAPRPLLTIPNKHRLFRV
uniref:Uncharacterized protein n=1 Tax=Anguilla anguilla TaxID=7936 RepID=A0A0E9QQU7_ANGAN